jgi:TPR repeat protein
LASEGRVTDATYRLGVIYEKLKGGDQNFSEAVRLYSEAIKQGDEDAMYRLAQLYHHCRGVECYYQRAYDLYARAAELGHSESARLLDITNYSIRFSHTANNKNTVFTHLDELKNTLSMIKFVVKKGDTHLQYQLGNFYMTNKDRLNYNEAFKWNQMAASNGLFDAIYQLGLLYEKGRGIVQDYRMACLLYSQANEKGHPESIYRLGIAYQHGLGVDTNISEAIDCYTKAAELGNNESQYKLGKLYDTGELVGKEPLKALNWYTKAYLNGNYAVTKDLYKLYNERPLEFYFNERLFRILSNIENTYKPDNRLYDQIYGFLYYRLGTMYRNGEGTEVNNAKALIHLPKAIITTDIKKQNLSYR